MLPTPTRRAFLRTLAGSAGLGAGLRTGLAGLAGALLAPARSALAGPELGPAAPFSADALRERARTLSGSPWTSGKVALPPALEALDYDAMRDIRYVREEDLWYGEHDFNVEFFHLGDRLDEPVSVYAVEGGRAREVLYSPKLFDFGDNELPGGALDAVRGFAGVRILYPLNTDEYKDELGAFLGASYFRLLGETMLYGLSARGLAIDTAAPTPEEFPVFRELYFEVPTDPGALVMHALLDSPSVAGAYRFEIRPGEDTVVDVDAALYPRTDLPGVGVAPLTSMFLFGPNDRLGVDDFREAVHDSDGLLMHTGEGEWIWRPLVNPETLRYSAFADPNVRGFGLMQRERRFSDYQDLEARYERRPSAWVEPVGDWGAGRVVLVELPTPNETEDNVVAFWRPDAVPAAGAETRLAYRLHWCLDVPAEDAPALRAVSTRTGSGDSIGRDPDEDPEYGTRLFTIDFVGDSLPEPGSAVEAVATATNASVSSTIVEYNEPRHAWRAHVRVRPAEGGGGAGDEPVEIRCYLALDGDALSETWLYRWRA